MGKQRSDKEKKKGRSAMSVCSIAGTAMIVIVILLCAMLVIPGVFGFQMYNVITGSMEPALKIGSLIYVKADDPAEVKEKEIIAFYGSAEDSGIITHRVVINNPVSSCFQTKGDANDTEDPTLVEYSRYIGSVKFKLPYMGRLFTIMTSLYGKIAAACVVGLGVILNLIGSRQEDSGEEQ